MDLLGLTCAQLADQFKRRYGKGHFHAAALYGAFFRDPDLRLERLDAFAASHRLRQQIQKDLRINFPSVIDRVVQDGVVKLVFGLADGLRIETVVIPMANHATVCISCQAGCRMNCRFCHTGRMGWRRNLTAEEIVAQVYAVRVHLGAQVRNVVFMGMGEPLDNFDHVVQAIEVMTDQRGLNIARSRITLSTVGLPQGIQRLSDLDWPQLKLAVSLNAPNDRLRNALMPVNLTHPLAALRQALHRYASSSGSSLFMEYVLIKGINDHVQYAVELAAFIENLPVKVNLIPYNPHSQSTFKAPESNDIRRFQQALINRRVFVRLRNSKGAGIQAACGQLGGDTLRIGHQTGK